MFDDARQPRIWITGFEPFGGMETNVSTNVVKTLIKLVKTNDEPIIWDFFILPVSKKGSLMVSESLLELEQKRLPDVIIHLGLCAECIVPQYEIKATNMLDMKISDNSGRKVSNQKISRLGPKKINTTAQFEKIDWDSIEPKIVHSSKSGTFICNETYYRSLNTVINNNLSNKNGLIIPVLFIHLPSEIHMDVLIMSRMVEKIGKHLLFSASN